MSMASTRAGRRLGWRLAALTAFAIAMGHLEAVVVVYIRHILGIVPTPEHLDRAVYEQVPHWLLATEQGREAATIVMLVTLAILVGHRPLTKLAVFLYAFGLWDIFYYVGLKVLIDWPASLQTMDLLFLIPVPWFAPVWLPVSIASVMVIVALFLFAREQKR
jgi:hypothetical protein